MDESGDQNTKIDGDNNTVNNIQQSAGEGQIILTEEIYKEILDDKVKIRTFELNAAHGEEKARLQKEIDDLKNLLANLPQAFEEAQIQIAKLKAKLEREGNEIGAEKLAVAITALEQADFSKADELFAEIEAREELAVKRSARAAYARGEIAEQQVRWHDAAEHYARASQLDPSFDNLIRAQELAHGISNYDSSLSLGLVAEKVAIAKYGEESSQHALVLHLFGASYHEKGQYKKAAPFYQQAMEINEAKFGKNDPQRALNMGGLAVVYKELEMYKDAEFLFKECLETIRMTLGNKNTHTASTINNIAGLYKRQGNYTDAEQLYQQAMNIYKEIFGENHPHTATSINNLADTYTELGKYEEALKLHWQAQNIYKSLLGENHPNIAASNNNIAKIYERQGRYKDADPLFEKAVKLLETTLGDEHPHTKGVRKNYEDNKKRIANPPKTTPK